MAQKWIQMSNHNRLQAEDGTANRWQEGWRVNEEPFPRLTIWINCFFMEEKKKKDVTAYIRGSFVYGIMDPEGDSIPKIQLV